MNIKKTQMNKIPHKNSPKKRKDCKYYISGKCDLSYQIHGYGKPFNSRKYGWMWKCCDYVLGKPCEDYKQRITKTEEK